MKKKLLLAAVTAMSVFTLAACSGDNSPEIATMRGGTLTVQDFYDKARTNQNSQQIVFDMILAQVFVNKFGDQVTDEAIQEEITSIFGDNFEEQLQASNLTRAEVEQSIKERLSLEAGIKSHIELTDADLKTAWETFHPEVEAQIIAVATEDEAKEIKEQLGEDDADFGKIAEEKSLDASASEQGKITFDSTSTTVPAEVQAAAWEMADGDISDPIAVNSASGQAFFIIKMVTTQEKGNDMSKFEDQINEIATNNKMNDQAFTTEVIGKELTAANVKIKDDAFAGILSNFIDTPETATTETSN